MTSSVACVFLPGSSRLRQFHVASGGARRRRSGSRATTDKYLCEFATFFSAFLPLHTHTHTTSQCALFSSLLFTKAIKKGHQPKSNGQAAADKDTYTPQISCDFPATSRRQQRKGEPAKIHRFFMPAREAANIMMGTRRAPVLVLFLRGSLKLVFGGSAAVWRAKSRIRRTWCRG